MSSPLDLTRRSFMIMPLCLAACKTRANLIDLTGKAMGTTYAITALDADNVVSEAALAQSVEAAFALVNRQMSNWDATSEVSRFNAAEAGETLRISPEFAQVLGAAHDVHQASEGRFDVAMGTLIDLWGFGVQDAAMRVPGEAEITDALACCGQLATTALDGTTLTKLNGGAQIYLSSIGKGFGVDLIAKTIEQAGISDYMIEIGGDLYASGNNPDGLRWQIGVETPAQFDRSIMQVVGLSGYGMATSGDYRNYFDEAGQRYSHIIDPTTGRPVTHDTASVTVLAESAMMADAWATALLVLGRERGLKIAQDREIAALFIDRDTSMSDTKYHNTATPAFAEITA